jgi:signal transduction histidine kinase
MKVEDLRVLQSFQAEKRRIRELFRWGAPIPDEEWSFRTKDGREVWALVSGTVCPRTPKQAAFWVLRLADITHYKELEQSFLAIQARLREVTSKLIDAQETERHKIAAELHDNVGQKLASLAAELDLVQERTRRLGRGLKLQQDLRGLSGLISELSEAIHEAATQLYPSVLRYLTLSAAIKDLAAGLTRGKVGLKFIHHSVPEKISDSAAVVLYRVAQEALRNAVTHSGTERLLVKLLGTRNGVELIVRDWGAGFDPAQHRAGLGLLTMKERVEATGGRFVLGSTPGKGTTVQVVLPAERVPPAEPERRWGSPRSKKQRPARLRRSSRERCGST